ncbi:MAG: M15 family metallopeptidase [Polyangiaceae bacterium]
MRAKAIFPLLLLVGGLSTQWSCASNASGGASGHEDEDPGDVASDDVTAGSYSCNAGTGVAYENGVEVGTLKLMKVGGKVASVKTGHAYLKLRAAMKAKGVTLSVNSGFRTMSEQRYFYNCYVTQSCNNGHFAYEPGYSNHQSGRAIDLQISDHPKFRTLLKTLELTDLWKETVPDERWHWEFFGADPGGPCGPAASSSDAGAPDARTSDAR